MDVVKVPECLDRATENLIGPASKGIGQTVGDIWFLLFGGPVSQLVQKRQIKYAFGLEKFREGLSVKLDEIPEQKRIEPSTQIIMSAMDDAQFCVEEEELRHMFENLISSSVNADKSSFVHPSFSGVIKQMTSFDAQVLCSFKNRKRWPIAHYKYLIKNGNLPIQKNVFLGDLENHDFAAISTSIDCLSTLGLISTEFINSLSEKSQYEPFRQTAMYLSLKSWIQSPQKPPHIIDVGITEGYVELTDMGNRFITVCLP